VVGSWPRRIGGIILALGGLAMLALLVWQGVTAHGNPDPAATHLDRTAVVLDTAILVLREGLEAILVLAAITASFMGAQASYRAPVALGAGLSLLASVATWFVAIAILDAVSAPALDIQAATGLLAVVVLLVVMNWFFHKIYWTGWIAHHTRRRRSVLDLGGDARSRLLLGLGLLGFTAVYREGFEIVLFLQTLRLQAGSAIVLQGVALGLACTAVVGAITFVAHHRLPYKKMLVLTGVMIGFVLVVMVGESVQEVQQAGWLATTPVGLPIPDWMGLWFAAFPNVEGLAAQALAALAVIGSYVVAEELRVRRPRRQGETPVRRPEQAPVLR
jgi:high-affinity iron transporter